MSPEKQRIAIAKACGIKVLDGDGYVPMLDKIPDYLNDLNAMSKAEKLLKHHALRRDYCTRLYAITQSRGWDRVTATASHRAEAFLKTIGKWE